MYLGVTQSSFKYIAVLKPGAVLVNQFQAKAISPCLKLFCLQFSAKAWCLLAHDHVSQSLC